MIIDSDDVLGCVPPRTFPPPRQIYFEVAIFVKVVQWWYKSHFKQKGAAVYSATP